MDKKISVSNLYLYKEPGRKGLDKDIFFFCEQPYKNAPYRFLRSKKVYPAEKIENGLFWGEEIKCVFKGKNAFDDDFEFEDEVFETQNLALLLSCDKFYADIPESFVRYLRASLTDSLYSPKKLLEIEEKFVEKQIARIVRQNKEAGFEF